jgi:hypothetical protein
MKLGLAPSMYVLSTSYLLMKSYRRICRPIKAKQKVVPEIFDYMILTILTTLTYKQRNKLCIVMIIITIQTI